MNLRESIDAQLNVLQRVYEGDTSPETIQEAVALNHQMHRLLNASPPASATGGVAGPSEILHRIVLDSGSVSTVHWRCVICGSTEQPCGCGHTDQGGFNV